jgi:hypothetical protein
MLARFVHDGIDRDPDERFAAGLERVLDGIGYSASNGGA